MKKKIIGLCALIIATVSMTGCSTDEIKSEIAKIYPHNNGMFLKCDQIPGSSPDRLAPKSVEILSYSFDFNVVENKGIGEFTLTSIAGIHSPQIVDLHFRKATVSKMEFCYYKYLAGKGELVYYVEFRMSKFSSYNIECGLETYTFYSERVTVKSRNINIDNSLGETVETTFDCTK